MEAFSLLKLWKGTSTLPQNDTDEGPFFDLELALEDSEDDDATQTQNDNLHHVVDDSNNNNNSDSDSHSDSDSDSEKDFKLTLSPSISSNDRSLSLSPSHAVILKGNLILNPTDPNSKPQFTASLLKSATKLRVFMLGLKKPKPAPGPNKRNADEVPIASLFTRDNSSRAKPSQTEEPFHAPKVSSASEEKRLLRKYLKMVKPLYVRVSRKYADKIKLNVASPDSAKPATPPSAVAEKLPAEAEASETEGNGSVKGQKQASVPLAAGLRKHLGKGRSAAPPVVTSKRRDDSLLQQHDWIQGAILHCKKSFNASTECESSEAVSGPLRERCPEKCSNEKGV
ncbi:hypothetical protein Fmac_003996 [Flemingia macrophylla]|uniref:Membrane-associated kinase regulator 2 n=1 Tax=Flemingia macrophylla TaxID=520843 RepID=A0ABD1N3R6_9FABA